MKNIISIIVIFAFISVTSLLYNYNKELENEKQNLEQLKIELLKLHNTIKADSNIIVSKAIEIKNMKEYNDQLSDKYKNVQKKYNGLLKSYVYIKGKMDSVLSLNVNVETDTLNNNYKFDTYFDLFKIYGYFNCNKPFMKANLTQIKPLILSLGIYKTNNDTPFVMVESNSKVLQFDRMVVKLYNYNKKNMLDNIKLSTGISVTTFGFNVGLYYNNYGIQYINYINRKELFFNYQTSLRDLWQIIKH